MDTEHDEHVQMVQDCIARESKLSAWERDFIDSIEKQIADGSLTEKQIQKLDRIWERVT